MRREIRQQRERAALVVSAKLGVHARTRRDRRVGIEHADAAEALPEAPWKRLEPAREQHVGISATKTQREQAFDLASERLGGSAVGERGEASYIAVVVAELERPLLSRALVRCGRSRADGRASWLTSIL
ncbi:MAG: hypothetical protein ACREM3_00215 [Candidatus Rokuibacteriota bacterium]